MDPKESTMDKLQEKGLEDAASLCANIFDWCEEGGPALIKEKISQKIEECRRRFGQDLERVRQVVESEE